MITLDPRTTALILIDLQKGIVPRAEGPRSGEDVVRTAQTLAQRFRDAGAPVILVHVGFTPETMPSQTVDRPSLPPEGTPLTGTALANGAALLDADQPEALP